MSPHSHSVSAATLRLNASRIPPETWLLAFSYLSRQDHLTLLRVSPTFRELAETFIFERINIEHKKFDPAGNERIFSCLRTIASRPTAASAVRWLDITVLEGDKNPWAELKELVEIIKEVLSSVEKLHVLRLYGFGANTLPKNLKKGCFQFLKAYRGTPGSLSDCGVLPSVIELGYFEVLVQTTWRYQTNDEPKGTDWCEVIRGLKNNFPDLRTLSLGNFSELKTEYVEALADILPSLRPERLDLVNFKPLELGKELTIIRDFHSICPTLRSIRLSTYHGDWRYLPEFEIWTTEDYPKWKLENEIKGRHTNALLQAFQSAGSIRQLWLGAEVKLRFPRA